MKNQQLEQLLTELTLQQTATVEGGAIFALRFCSLRSEEPNDPRLRINGQTILSQENMAPGCITINVSRVVFNSPLTLQIWEMNPPPGLAGDVLLGQRTIPVENADGYATLGGYRLYYQVTGA
jgi:hypothetical protein